VGAINCSEFYKRQEEFLSRLREVSILLTEQKYYVLIIVILHEPEYFMNNMIICFDYFYMC
jgi:hypothetical protein